MWSDVLLISSAVELAVLVRASCGVPRSSPHSTLPMITGVYDGRNRLESRELVSEGRRGRNRKRWGRLRHVFGTGTRFGIIVNRITNHMEPKMTHHAPDATTIESAHGAWSSCSPLRGGSASFSESCWAVDGSVPAPAALRTISISDSDEGCGDKCALARDRRSSNSSSVSSTGEKCK